AIGRRQQSLVKASLPKLLNSFVRHTTVRFTSRRTVSKIGNQCMSARDEIFVSWGFDESGCNAHGFSPTKRLIEADTLAVRIVAQAAFSAAGKQPVLSAAPAPPSAKSAEQRHELAAPDHSITSSARASSVSGTVRPSVLAVLRLSTSSNFVDSMTGSSAGVSP